MDGAGVMQVSTQDDYVYLDADKKIEIYKMTAGRYSYNAQTKTIKLFSLEATNLNINIKGQTFKLELYGTSSLEDVDSLSSIVVNGSGSIVVDSMLTIVKPSGLTVQGGTIDGTISCGWLKMQGGTIKNINPQYEGMYVTDGDLTMTGGTIQITGAHAAAIDLYKKVDGKFVGKAVFKGGSVTAKVLNPDSKYAIWAGSIANALSCMKEIAGLLSPGAKFKAGKNIYKVIDENKRTVKLFKYHGGEKAVVNRVSYGRVIYKVTGIGNSAFNTKEGKAVTRLTIKPKVSQIGSKAFYGMSSLERLRIPQPYFIERTGKGKTLKLKVRSECSVSKTAFAKCGKNGGKGLVVKLYSKGVHKSEASTYKKFLASKGLSTNIKLKQY